MLDRYLQDGFSKGCCLMPIAFVWMGIRYNSVVTAYNTGYRTFWLMSPRRSRKLRWSCTVQREWLFWMDFWIVADLLGGRRLGNPHSCHLILEHLSSTESPHSRYARAGPMTLSHLSSVLFVYFRPFQAQSLQYFSIQN